MTKQGLEIARKNFFIALTIDLAVTVIVTYFGFSLLDTLKMLNAGTLVPDAALISSTTFKENFSYLAIATTLGVGFMLVKWVEACYAYAKEQLGATGFEREKWLRGNCKNHDEALHHRHLLLGMRRIGKHRVVGHPK